MYFPPNQTCTRKVKLCAVAKENVGFVNFLNVRGQYVCQGPEVIYTKSIRTCG